MKINLTKESNEPLKAVMKVDALMRDNADEHMCADCGLSFTSGDERDDHFMTTHCVVHSSSWNDVIHRIRYVQQDADEKVWDELEEIADSTTALVVACIMADKHLRGDATAQQLRAALDKITNQ